jgi:hypothetical protein
LARAVLALALGPGSTVRGTRQAHFYPQLQFLAQSIRRGEAPWWAPTAFSGHPQIADPQSLIFSPPHLLLALLDADPSFRAADAVERGMLGLGGVALILLFRDRAWHLDRAPSRRRSPSPSRPRAAGESSMSGR